MMNGNKQSLSLSGVTAPFQGLGAWVELCKIHLCLYIGLSAIFGHVAAAGGFSGHSLAVGFFVFMLATGAAVLNNIQDRKYDRFFIRTCHRTLASGRVNPGRALLLSCILIVGGLSGLWLTAGGMAPVFGGTALLCYNAVYTPMKKKTLLAVIPGSLCGMIVPVIGWTAAGGAISDPVIHVIMIVFGLWQISHYFIILLKTGQQRKHLKGAGQYPNFFDLFSIREVKIQTLIWTSLYSLALLLFVVLNSHNHLFLYFGVMINAWATLVLIFWLVCQKRMYATLAFAAINLSILLFIGTGISSTLVL